MIVATAPAHPMPMMIGAGLPVIKLTASKTARARIPITVKTLILMPTDLPSKKVLNVT
ncbi:hypothetical protein L336_0939 [Candidatus Saccharimonas aalborgensis]|uniref:Uncharacterized protein n=1 Tax=Candidatus Saccharimonas aalborgensis TaxID=1332188 RepID=R4PLW3_9BACT|nr:hypothetical protein [Candidatus Saccharimonas aalborgensis]AGL62638.1 hypothetical protein L336_0939 [Candidatus Saccharimonas aalborgensis]QQS68139.1 MAG: hypothetical protein IPP24_03960 [Candidatus Saccharibacteria bacterium]